MIRNQGGLVPVKAVVYSDPSTTTKSTAYSRDGIVGGIAVCHEEIDGMFMSRWCCDKDESSYFSVAQYTYILFLYMSCRRHNTNPKGLFHKSVMAEYMTKR